MNHWFNYEATSKILVFSMLLGAGLPALFALGVRLQAAGAGVIADHAAPRRPVLVVLGWAIFALVLAVVVIGVLYIARDFIAHHLGWHILGAKRA
ncbi:putative transmembrane protein [Mycobacterium kansasii 732]|uniref:Transmembrane protein n=1 Tax=Mycobacterium pseudokansasii TaxID=2341080 RepID=A0A498QKN8_9MYCO|nr:hypothetical protein [Mycobacterium pseudokansasii]EUA14682.1 putative transmembrane protein [Mycobacterium kansasii 732]KZS66893.1 hypothetical protein A4G27_17490 [Mycobacterium kansasii]VAZ89267.1 hypothetical protein LAUMK35_00901 [Mycobacterium pseudokansasii]VAZ89962.1 hypothetical protein LAUMK21_00900 [Mycobacterium pseudokansasii]VBA47448.1 hypothetical protein LAUMK142_00764 [Mycobacterium pseudokansasii]